MANKVIVSTKLEYEDALEFGIDKRKLVVIPVGVDSNAFQQERCYSDSSPLKLLFVGRLARNRNVEVLIETAAQMQNVHLTIVGGEGRTSSTSKLGYVNELMGLARSLNAEGKVFFAGPKYGEQLKRFYLESDLFLYPSSYENFGQPILEAATFGLPIISTRVGVALDIVIPGETGFLTNLNREEIMRHIKSLEPAKVRKEFGIKIRNLVEKNYQWTNIIDQYIQVYREL